MKVMNTADWRIWRETLEKGEAYRSTAKKNMQSDE